MIDGNHQLRAARELGWDKIAATPFVMDDGNGGTREATVAEANAYALAANHTSDLGTYDEAELLAMMQSVYLNDVSMFEATSYSESDLLGAGDPPLTDPDDVPEIGRQRSPNWATCGCWVSIGCCVGTLQTVRLTIGVADARST